MWIKHLSERLTTVQLLTLFALLTCPMWFAPFMADDFFHLMLLADKSPLPHIRDGSLWGLFSFIHQDPDYRQALIHNGVLPWWVSDKFYFIFWRPLAEISHKLDFILAPYSSVFAHIHSIAWFLALALLFRQLLKELKLNTQLIFIAFFIFLFDGHHAAVIEWIANRNALMSAFFMLLALLLHHHSSKQQAIFYTLLALASLALGLFSGEAALAGGGYFFAYALLLDRRGFLRGFAAILPYLVLVLVWMAIRSQLGFGADGSVLLYIDPLVQPQEFLQALLTRLPMTLFFLFSVLPAETFPMMLFFGDKAVWIYFCIAMAFVLFLFLICFRLLKHQATIQFFLLGAVISIIPFCSLITQDRLLLIPSIGTSVVIAYLIQQGVFYTHKHLANGRQKLLKFTSYTLLITHMVIAPVYFFIAGITVSNAALNQQHKILAVEEVKEGQTVIIAKGALLSSALFKVVRTFEEKIVPEQVLLLSDFSRHLTLERLSESDFILTRTEGFSYLFEQSFRDIQKEPFAIGDELITASVKLSVLEINESGQPVKLQVSLLQTLDNYLFLNEEERAFTPIQLPAIGETMPL